MAEAMPWTTRTRIRPPTESAARYARERIVYRASPATMNHLRPRRSESLPKNGMSRARETEKPEKIAPIARPVAPRVSA
jgi:hypothetical protein